VERLWSYLRRFPALSEEMTQSHRIDLLSDALLYYPIYKNDSMDSGGKMDDIGEHWHQATTDMQLYQC